MARKTIEVGKILNIANHFLAAKNTTADEREGVCATVSYTHLTLPTKA